MERWGLGCPRRALYKDIYDLFLYCCDKNTMNKQEEGFMWLMIPEEAESILAELWHVTGAEAESIFLEP